MDIALDNNLVYDFKFGGHIPNLDGTISSYWENDLPGASYSGDNFKMVIIKYGNLKDSYTLFR